MYELGDLGNWTGRNTKANDEYLFQKVKILDLEAKDFVPQKDQNNYAFLGFCCDEGVRRNQGRVGAVEGPKSIRNCLAKMPLPDNNSLYYDAGDVICTGSDLESAQVELGQKIMQIKSLGFNPIVIGGGHETAWGHFLGLKDYFFSDENSAILNFDAHFDLRKTENSISTSGTPFYQISEFLKSKGSDLHYYCAGLQKCANTKSLFDYAKLHNVKYILAEEITKCPTNLSFIEQVIEKHDNIYISICLDVFNAAIAPGVSAPQALGIYSEYVIEALRVLKQSNKVISLDLVELCPTYDTNQQTAKLASCLLFEYLS